MPSMDGDTLMTNKITIFLSSIALNNHCGCDTEDAQEAILSAVSDAVDSEYPDCDCETRFYAAGQDTQRTYVQVDLEEDDGEADGVCWDNADERSGAEVVLRFRVSDFVEAAEHTAIENL